MMLPTAQEADEITYDAFISYSRRDKAFATLLQKALEGYLPPKDLNVPQRHLRIFRDEQDFTGTEYHQSLDKHLHESAKLMVVCSPHARYSIHSTNYVDDEIRRFSESKGPKNIIPVLLSGIANNEAAPGQEADMAFPEALCKVMAIPLAADYRGFRVGKDKIEKGRFEDAWHKILADLYAKSRAEIEQRERKRRIRRLWVAATVSSLVLLVMGGMGSWLWRGSLTLEHAVLRVASKVTSIHMAPKMKIVPAGTFRQGDIHGERNPIEQPVHEVTIKKFAIGQFEVTFEEYDRFAIATGRQFPYDQRWGRGRRPVINVTWQDAVDYAKWLSHETGKHYRLPTESEWEYAARSGGKDDFWAGTSDEKQLKDYAVYLDNSELRTAIVGGKQPNGLELYDMSGNAWEYVEDCWHENYNGAPTDGTAWLEGNSGDCDRRVMRGGSWGAIPKALSSSGRTWTYSGEEQIVSDFGFRLAQDID